MNIFKQAYKTVRKNSNDIYNGFGFKHLSDVTNYYVHPNNLSKTGRTSLAQSIGESIILFSRLIHSADTDNSLIDYFYNKDVDRVFLKFKVPEDYHDNDVVFHNIDYYCVLIDKKSIKLSAYNKDGKFIHSSINDLDRLYKLLPMFCAVLALDVVTNVDMTNLLQSFLKNSYVDIFVNLHEDFYQLHKFDDFELTYTDLSGIDLSSYQSCLDLFHLSSEGEVSFEPIISESFNKNDFETYQISLIPNLSDEFLLPENLINVANATVTGDLQAILLHGPAGTGKTMSCKLIAQAIKLPIMDTINCTENLDEFVLGKYIPEDDRIIFQESYVTKAIRDGGAVIFEEINMAKPQHLAFLNSLLDDNGFVRLDNGEMVQRNKNFRFFATMNMGYFGTKELNQALYNRFNAIIEIENLSDDAIRRMLLARVPECSDKLDKVLNIYHKIRQKIKVEALDMVISPRNLENWMRMAKYDGYLKAAEMTIIPIAKSDRILEDTIRGILSIYRWE